jgi:3-dehydroquinate dehydratase/shikimate dehydrogenase
MSWNCQVPTIGLVIGERGLISRIICAKFSGYLTFGTLESGFVSAPGQPTIKDLLDLYDFRQIGPDTKVFGIIGKPVGHSKSPFLYNEAFKSVGFNGVCAFISGWHCKFSPDLLIHRFCRISGSISICITSCQI